MTLDTMVQLNSLFQNKLNSQTFKVKTSYKLLQLSSAAEKETKFYHEQLTKILNTYGKRDENNELVYENEGVKIQEDKIVEAQKELEELINFEITKPPISFELEEFENTDLTLEDLRILTNFINEKE